MRVPLPVSPSWAGCLALVGACGAAEPVEPAVQLGTGEVVFEPLVDGGEVLVVHGPQGGYHLVGSVRARGIEAGDADRLDAPDNPTVTFRALFGGVDLTLTGQYRQGLDPIAPGADPAADAEGWTHEMVGRLCILDITDDDEIAGQTVDFEVEVQDAAGASWSDSLTLTVGKDPRNL